MKQVVNSWFWSEKTRLLTTTCWAIHSKCRFSAARLSHRRTGELRAVLRTCADRRGATAAHEPHQSSLRRESTRIHGRAEIYAGDSRLRGHGGDEWRPGPAPLDNSGCRRCSPRIQPSRRVWQSGTGRDEADQARRASPTFCRDWQSNAVSASLSRCLSSQSHEVRV